ncbi:MAG: hypothetical protein JXB50_04310 [Spirochaetes bacterium]|nr:hypothetical protein [Spirochaetota bacterium]
MSCYFFINDFYACGTAKVKTGSNKDSFITLFKLIHGYISSDFNAVFKLNSELFYYFYIPVKRFIRQSVIVNAVACNSAQLFISSYRLELGNELPSS